MVSGRFNTSHVTLYPEWGGGDKAWWAFQYISCYSLSGSVSVCDSVALVSIHLMLLFIYVQQMSEMWKETFQYISCYSLSLS